MKQKNKYNQITLFDPIFCATIYVVIGVQNSKDVDEWLKQNLDVQYSSHRSQFNARTLTIDDGMSVCMFFKSFKFDANFCANLCHEAFHAAHIILSYRGQINLDQDGEESHAYFMSWIVKETLNRLKQNKHK